MIRRITRFSPHQTAKVLSLVYFPIGVLMAAVVGLEQNYSVLVIVLLPVLYSCFVYISTSLGCLIYNLGALWVGGIEVEVDDAPSA